MFVVTGGQGWALGTADGRYPAVGFHTRGEMDTHAWKGSFHGSHHDPSARLLTQGSAAGLDRGMLVPVGATCTSEDT